jgi:hypothetical protein
MIKNNKSAPCGIRTNQIQEPGVEQMIQINSRSLASLIVAILIIS